MISAVAFSNEAIYFNDKFVLLCKMLALHGSNPHNNEFLRAHKNLAFCFIPTTFGILYSLLEDKP